MPTRLLPNLALSLNNRSNRLTESGRVGDADAAWVEVRDRFAGNRWAATLLRLRRQRVPRCADLAAVTSVRRRSELLSDDGATALDELATQRPGDGAVARHRELLRACLEQGIDVAYRPLFPASTPPSGSS